MTLTIQLLYFKNSNSLFERLFINFNELSYIKSHIALCSHLQFTFKQSDGAANVQASSPDQANPSLEAKTKTRVVVLGSGWAAMSFLKAWDPALSDKYELILVSPRNYFVYTPLLPAMCAGTVEERSIVEPVRAVLGNKGKFFEAKCTEIMPEERSIVACFPEDAGFPEACFRIPYDTLVLGVGCINNTFGIQGVQENTLFFKSVEDAAKLRLRISECFERSALPQTTAEERRKLLSFVIVGGGPTGVEVAAELYDLIVDDLSKLYPEQVQDFRIRVVDLMSHVLSTYDRKISNYTAETFKRNGIDLVLNSRVQGVSSDSVTVVDNDGNVTELPFGACVWATGIAMHPLIKQLQERLPEGKQNHFRSIITDEYLRVRGAPDNSIFALGDAATIEQQKALDKADELFERAPKDSSGGISLKGLREIMREAGKEFPHLEEHASFLDTKTGIMRFGGVVAKAFKSASATVGGSNGAATSAIYKDIDENSTLDREQFKDLLKTIDLGLRALPATAQVAKQEGEFLAHVFANNDIRPGFAMESETKPFEYFHRGSLAYVGSDRAVMDVPVIGPVMGLFAGYAWRGFETFSQISLRNQCLVTMDWARTKIFGRDTSRV
jgi:NADH:ubiquinone reductase (non-electrogenic)